MGPNWSVPRNTSALVNGHTGSYFVASATFIRESILQVTGAAVSTIAVADSESGKFQVEDPRLAGVRLPAGWGRKRHLVEEFWTWFVNDETREDNGYFDPRLNLDELKSRGVELEVFDLI